MSILPIKKLDNTDESLNKEIPKIESNNLNEQLIGTTLKPINITDNLPVTKEVPLSPIASAGKTNEEIFNEIREVALSSFKDDLIVKEDTITEFKKLNQFLSYSPNAHMLISDLSIMLSTTYVKFQATLLENDTFYRSQFQLTADEINMMVASVSALNDNVQSNYAYIDLTATQIRSEVAQQIQTSEGNLLTQVNTIVQTSESTIMTVVEDELNAFGFQISQQYTSIQQFSNSISLLATKNQFNDLGDIVSQNTSSISLLSDSINLKVSTVDFNTLSQQVATIELESDSISLTVSNIQTNVTSIQGDIITINDEIDTLDTNLIAVTQDVAAIQIQANEISLSVTTLEGDLSATELELNDLSGLVATNTASITLNSQNISLEVTARQDADNNLQSLIDIEAGKIDLLVGYNITDGYYPSAGLIINAINTNTDASELRIFADKIIIDGTTNFGEGYNPSTKRRVFRSTPTVPYDTGDLWLASTSSLSTGVLKVAKFTKTSAEIFSDDDWELATGYGKGKTSVYIDGSNPARDWTTVDLKIEHLGDEWIHDTVVDGETYKLSYIYKEVTPVDYDWELNNTVIDGANIITNSIKANKIDVIDLFAQNITANGTITGVTLIGSVLDVTSANLGGWIAASNMLYTSAIGNKILLDGNSKAIQIVKDGIVNAAITASELTPISELNLGHLSGSGIASPLPFYTIPNRETTSLFNYSYDGWDLASHNDKYIKKSTSSTAAILSNAAIDNAYFPINTGETYNIYFGLKLQIELEAIYQNEFSHLKYAIPALITDIQIIGLTGGTPSVLANLPNIKIKLQGKAYTSLSTSYIDSITEYINATFNAGTATQAYLKYKVVFAEKLHATTYKTYIANYYYQAGDKQPLLPQSNDVKVRTLISDIFLLKSGKSITEIATNGIQSVWGDNKYIRIQGDASGGQFIESKGVWIHNGYEMVNQEDVINIDQLANYYTKAYTDSNFAAIHGSISENFSVYDLHVENNIFIVGDIDRYNQTELNIGDTFINLAVAQPVSLDGGIRIYGANNILLSTFKYKVSNNRWNFDKGIDVLGTITATGYNKTNWDSAYSHISLTNNPHNVTPAQLNAGRYLPSTDGTSIIGTYLGGSVRTTNVGAGSVGFPTSYGSYYTFDGSTPDRVFTIGTPKSIDDIYFQTYDANGVGNNWKRFYHSSNANLSTVDWSAYNLIASNEISTRAIKLYEHSRIDMIPAVGESALIQLGHGRTDNGNAYIDFVGDATYSDYGLRIIRTNTGANASSYIQHRGTGRMIFQNAENSDWYFYGNGNVTIGLDGASTIHNSIGGGWFKTKIGSNITGNWARSYDFVNGNNNLIGSTGFFGTGQAPSYYFIAVGDGKNYNSRQITINATAPSNSLVLNTNSLDSVNQINSKALEGNKVPFASGFGGQGWKIDEDGNASFKSVEIRQSLKAYSFDIEKLDVSTGSQIFTSSIVIHTLVSTNIYFVDKGYNPFAVNTILRCQVWDGQGSIKYYQIKVTSYQGLSASYKDEEGNFLRYFAYIDLQGDTPAVGDILARVSGSIMEATSRGGVNSDKAYIQIAGEITATNESWVSKFKIGDISGDASIAKGSAAVGYGINSRYFTLDDTGAYFQGVVKSTSGNIGGLTIANSNLSGNIGSNYINIYTETSGGYPALRTYNSVNRVMATMGQAYYSGVWQNEFGFTLVPDYSTTPYLQFTKNLTTNALTAKIANFTFDNNKLYAGASAASLGAGISLDSANKSFMAYQDSNNYTTIYHSSPSSYGLKVVSGGNTIIHLGNETKISAFEIDANKLWSGGVFGSANPGIELNATSKYINLNYNANSYIKLYYNGLNDWGLKGIKAGINLFQLGDTNKIANWNIEEKQFSADYIKLNNSINPNVDNAYGLGINVRQPSGLYGTIGQMQFGQIYSKHSSSSSKVVKLYGTDPWENYGINISTHLPGYTEETIRFRVNGNGVQLNSIFIGTDSKIVSSDYVSGTNIGSISLDADLVTISTLKLLNIPTAIPTVADVVYRRPLYEVLSNQAWHVLCIKT